MNQMTMRLLSAILLTFCVAAMAQPAPPPVVLPPQVREVSPEAAQRLITQTPGISILDVRTAGEVAEQGRIKGSEHLDFFREDFLAQVAKLRFEPTRPCVVYCALGGRAKRAAKQLAESGFKDLVVLQGGFNAWKKAGLPVEARK